MKKKGTRRKKDRFRRGENVELAQWVDSLSMDDLRKMLSAYGTVLYNDKELRDAALKLASRFIQSILQTTMIENAEVFYPVRDNFGMLAVPDLLGRTKSYTNKLAGMIIKVNPQKQTKDGKTK